VVLAGQPDWGRYEARSRSTAGVPKDAAYHMRERSICRERSILGRERCRELRSAPNAPNASPGRGTGRTLGCSALQNVGARSDGAGSQNVKCQMSNVKCQMSNG
jgi:hypothetical protein